MEGKRFLIVIADEEEQANVKEKCELRGCSVICANNSQEASKYISSLTTYHKVIIDIDPPNDETIVLCDKIKQISPKTFIIALYSSEHYDKVNKVTCNALLLKPLYACTFDMVLSNS